MIEREIQVPEERKLAAAVIYNRLSAGTPLGIDATIRYEDQNYTEQLTESRLDEPTRRTTRGSTRACRRRRSETPASPRSRPPPTRRSPTPSTSSSSPAPATSTSSSRRRRSSTEAEAEYQAALEAPRAARRPNAEASPTEGRRQLASGVRIASARCIGSPSRISPVAHSRSPAMQNAALAELGLAGEWSYEAIEVAPEDFGDAGRARCRRGIRRGQRHRSAQARRARARRQRLRRRARDRRREHAHASPTARIAADNTDASGLIAALPEPPQGRRALVLGAGGSARAVHLGAARGRRGGGDLEPHRREGRALAAELGPSCGRRSRRALTGDFDLLVNSTTVGLDAANPAARAPAATPGR